MSGLLKVRKALVSVFYKDGLDEIVKKLHDSGVEIYSTGGTKEFIEKLGLPVISVEQLTGYPSILGGRVKTLHPKVFGGILARRENMSDVQEIVDYQLPLFDLVIVDLYPFEETVNNGGTEAEIIEKIDIGGISLIRAAAKNFKDVLIVSDRTQYTSILDIIANQNGETSLETRRRFAMEAFDTSSHYDSAIFNYFAGDVAPSFKVSIHGKKELRYGENPHQKGAFYGNFDDVFEQLHGKEISYNNLLDIDAAQALIAEFSEPTIAILKHNNACGIATRDQLCQAWKDALAGDPVSAYGGIVISNSPVDEDTAKEIDKIFIEVLIAPAYLGDSVSILQSKKNRIILRQKESKSKKTISRTVLNGFLVQDADYKTETVDSLRQVTNRQATEQEVSDMLFANKVVKHTKSNAIVLAKGGQLLGSGGGQTSRVDALKSAIEKAREFGFDLQGAVMASDAFFPFADSVEIAYNAGITAVIQPGGSVRDKETIDFCNGHNLAMVFTGIRHFKH